MGHRYSIKSRILDQIRHLHRLVSTNDESCLRNLRIDCNTFGRLCYLLEHARGLSPTKHLSVPEQVVIFLSVVSHHKKNCVVKYDFIRSGRTISRHFYCVLNTILKLHTMFLAKPTPIPEDCLDVRWRWFKGCLGALDGTYIDVRVPEHEKGSAADSRVLRDAIHHPNGLRVLSGSYYLCDNRYTNSEGFLIPYRGVHYHLREWDRGGGGPKNHEELFNLKHSSARNVIERAFGLLKIRWES
ncbi:UNVERIFIED_CONTAM: hypothetical protein Slati_2400000 [Sesamum latifolium]|uniref:DDE Tnp4 domain-containing protein n=1 Tax=Sesamum latifolium TaxID=2727402 RepID=A0AAW2WG66_9LAMI